jgi:hypothetical protein
VTRITLATLTVLSMVSPATAAEAGRYQIIPEPPVTGGANYMVLDTSTGELWEWGTAYASGSGNTARQEAIWWRYMGKPKVGTFPGQFVEYDPESAKFMAGRGWTPPQ